MGQIRLGVQIVVMESDPAISDLRAAAPVVGRGAFQMMSVKSVAPDFLISPRLALRRSLEKAILVESSRHCGSISSPIVMACLILPECPEDEGGRSDSGR
jgi:hypothetical protein